MASAARTPNPRGQGAKLHGELLDAAIALIDESDGPPSLTLRGVARRAGVSAPSIYPHFDGLADLTEQVLARSFDELYEAVSEATARKRNPANALIAAGAAYVTFAWEHKARYRLMFSAGGYAPNAVATYQLVEHHIRACAEAGLSRSTDPHLDAWMLWAGLHGVATLEKPARADYLRLGPLDRPAMLKTIIARLVRLRPASTGEQPG